MTVPPSRSIWTGWILQELIQWGAALALFFGFPWAYYQQRLVPQLRPVQALQTLLDQEFQTAQDRDWERWAGEAMRRVQTAVHEIMNQQPEEKNRGEAKSMNRDSLRVISAPALHPKSQAQPAPRRKRSGGILLRVPGVGPDDIVWNAIHEFYAAPYRYGGVDRFGVDCSGLVREVLRGLGVAFPRTAQAQFDSRLGVYVGINDLRPGDLLFFHTRTHPYVSHVGIYMGNDEFLHAPRTGRRVEIEPLAGYYRKRFIAGKRILADPFDRFQKQRG